MHDDIPVREDIDMSSSESYAEQGIKARLETSYADTKQRFADFKGGSLEAWNTAYASGHWAMKTVGYTGKLIANAASKIDGAPKRYDIHPFSTPIKYIGGGALKAAGVGLYYGPKELALSTDAGKDYLKRKEKRQSEKLKKDLEKKHSAEKVARRLNRVNRASRRAGKQYAVDKDGNVVVSKTA